MHSTDMHGFYWDASSVPMRMLLVLQPHAAGADFGVEELMERPSRSDGMEHIPLWHVGFLTLYRSLF